VVGRVADRLASEDGGLMESQGGIGCVVCFVQRHVHVEEKERERGDVGFHKCNRLGEQSN
jgi:hypothetical protein